MATREGRAIRAPRGWNTYENEVNNYEVLFTSLYSTACKVRGLSEAMADIPTTERASDEYILLQLCKRGRIAYHKDSKLWLACFGNGRVNAYGRWDMVTLWGKDGYTRTVPADSCYIFKANPTGAPLIAQIIRERALMLSDFDTQIARNMDDIKGMTIIYTDDKDLAARVEALNLQRLAGSKPYGVVTKAEGSFAKLDYVTTNAPYLVDKLIADRRAVFEDTLHLVGVQTPIEKGERMITNEVATQNAEPAALIGILIKSFNADSERQNAPFKLEYSPQPVRVDITDSTGESGAIQTITSALGGDINV